MLKLCDVRVWLELAPRAQRFMGVVCLSQIVADLMAVIPRNVQVAYINKYSCTAHTHTHFEIMYMYNL